MRLDPNLAEARRLLGALELSAAEKDPSRLPFAIEQLSAARRLAPGDIATAVGLARALLADDRAAEAADVLDDLPEVAGQPAIQRLTADAKAKSGHWSQAEALYRSLHEADPADREITAALIDLYEDQDKMDEALALLEELRKRDPGNTAVSERIVLDLARAGRFEESEREARELIAKRPENAAAKRLLATILFEKERVGRGRKGAARTHGGGSRRCDLAPRAGVRVRAGAALRRGARPVRGADSPRRRRSAQGRGQAGRDHRARLRRVPPEGLGPGAPDPRAGGSFRKAGSSPGRAHSAGDGPRQRGLRRRAAARAGVPGGASREIPSGSRRWRSSSFTSGTRRPPWPASRSWGRRPTSTG